ncbi:hypothetical protein PHYBOEH_001913 [Phytophthora boehmeriae]|uniref:BZIP domain-containing protein n=1 Tax=Phytophthora boehmeriae TaxID=109152 RepID=A0A8T1WVD0_9STRA|nr:hypothetical protein PHYBOEH_001913 [Phytophthora boehmeriae]
MDDHRDTAADRNPSSPAAMSGIDWSIFKDGEEDAFGWLLRNNSSAAKSVAGASDILPLEDLEVDRMVAATMMQKDQAAASAAYGTSQANARLLAAQVYEGLRPTPAGVMPMMPTVAPLESSNLSIDGGYDDFEDDDDEAWEQSEDQLTPTAKATNEGEDAAVDEEKAPASSRKARGKPKTTSAGIAKSKRPLKRKKSGSSSPTISVAAGDEEDQEKKQLRRVKNLVSVREFRKRKMKQLEQNEARLRRLEAENMDLKMRLKIGKEAILSEQREKKQIKEQMREMLQRNATEQEIAQFLNMYKITYSDYGPKRREKLHFHLSRIRELLLPTQVTKLSLYSVEQGIDMLKRDNVIKEDPMSAPESATATMSLWGILADELEVSDEQQRQILERRVAIKKVRDDLNHTLSIVKQLEEVTDEKNTALEAQVAQLQHILTPSQATKFIIWVKENPAFMYMLDKLVDSTLQSTSNNEEES